MRVKKNQFIVPVQLLSACLRERLHDELRLFFLLKSVSQDGKIQKSKQLREYVCDKLGFRSERTYYNHLDRLHKLYWVNDSDGILYVRSIKRILVSIYGNKIDLKNRVVMYHGDLNMFEEFIFSSTLLHEINARESRVAHLKGRAIQALKGCRVKNINAAGKDLQERKTTQSFQINSGETFSPNNVSLNFLVDLLGIPKTRIYRLKKRSKNCGYIDYKANFYRTCIPAFLLDKFKKDNPKYSCKSFTKGGQIIVRMTDTIKYGSSLLDIYGPNSLQ